MGVAFLLAAVAFVVGDGLPCDKLPKALSDILQALDLQRQVIEILMPLKHMLTVTTHKQITVLPTIDTIDQMLKGRMLETLLDPIKQHIEELLGILLPADVNRVTFEILEGETEVLRVVLLLFSELEVGEHRLELMQEVVVEVVAAVVHEVLWHAVFRHENEVAEWYGEEELLKHRDHVADAAQVAKAGVAVLRTYLFEVV